MEKILISVEVPKAPYDMIMDMVALVDLVDEQLENGFQALEDGSAVVFSKELVAAVKSLANYKAVMADVKADKEGAGMALLLGVKEAIVKIQD